MPRGLSYLPVEAGQVAAFLNRELVPYVRDLQAQIAGLPTGGGGSAEFEARLAEAEEDIAALEVAMADAQADILGLEAGLTQAQQDIVDLQADLDAIAHPPLVLDKIPIPALCAFSASRKLRRAYAGPALRVRRTDNAEQDIGFVSDALDVASLLSFVGGGSGFVTTLYDNGVSGRNLSQADPAKQPIIVNAGSLVMTTGAGATGLPTMMLDTGRTLERNDACGLTGSPAITMAARFRSGLTTGYPTMCRIGVGTLTTTGRLFSLQPNLNNGMYVETINNGKSLTIGGLVGDSRYYVAQSAAGGLISAFSLRDGGVVQTQTGLAGTTSIPMNLANERVAIGGGLGSGAGVYKDATGDLNALFIFNAVLAGADLTALETELAAHR